MTNISSMKLRTFNERDELVHYYSQRQGSEFPYVIMPLMKSHYIMLQRNLLYTAITRAKKGLIIIGEKKAVYVAVMNNQTVERHTKLAERLIDLSHLMLKYSKL